MQCLDNSGEVTDSICGYAGGSSEDANYNKVSTGRTGHAEAVKLIFDENTLPKRGPAKHFLCHT